MASAVTAAPKSTSASLSASTAAMVNMIWIILCICIVNLHLNLALEHINYQDDTHISLNAESRSSLCSSSSSGVVPALGMESGVIPDAAITASSSYNEQSVGPQNARLNRELSGGAWCPSRQLSEANIGKEWLQVNFTGQPPGSYVITGIATQGRFGNGMGVEFTEEYWLEYSRDNGETWHKWRSRDGSHILMGNDDTYTVSENQLSLPLVGINVIRVIPISQHLRTVCLRVELYGCPYKDGPISYSMMDGVYGGRFGDLLDKTYDGDRSDTGYLSNGIGQLIDGIKGDDNYKVNKGFEWIGWKSHSNDIVSITFEFSEIRNFTLAAFHCHNIFTKEMEAFSSAKIWFSFDARRWSQVPEDFEYMPDHSMERARDVMVHLHHRVGRFVKFDLRMASKWLLISEVRFDSRPVNRNFRMDLSELESTRSTHKPITPAAINNNRSMIRESFLLIVFSVLGLIITISLVLYIFHVRRRKGKMTGVDYVTMSMKDVATTPLYCEPRDVNRSLSPFPGAVNGTDPEYAVPDVIGGSPPTTSTFVPPNNGNNIIVNNNNHQQRYYASADVLNRNAFTDFGNYHYASTAANNCSGTYQDDDTCNYEPETSVPISPAPPDPQLILPQSMPNLSDKDVTLLKPQVGYSRFGDVALGQLNDSLVILKALQNDDCRQEFFTELAEKWRISSSCDHFAKLYGLINSPEYVAMVIEHGDCDLRQYLRNANPAKVGYSTLIYIASEIASAMHQLQSMGFVHRDLATRNCLIYTGKLVVKISDSGAFISDYKEDYYKEVLPIRWMAPESILKGRFTAKSDVYSFGVTLWEILTYCKIKPHSHLSDDALLKTVYHQTNGKLKNGTYYRHPFESTHDQRQQLILPKPESCPKEIYDLMVECWEKNEKARPEFREICVFLQRKNLGFQKPNQ